MRSLRGGREGAIDSEGSLALCSYYTTLIVSLVGSYFRLIENLKHYVTSF